MSDKTKIEFRKGFLRGDVRVSSCEMREPTVADQLNAQETGKGAAAQELHLFASLCELSPDELRSLSLHDYGRLQSAYADFLA